MDMWVNRLKTIRKIMKEIFTMSTLQINYRLKLYFQKWINIIIQYLVVVDDGKIESLQYSATFHIEL